MAELRKTLFSLATEEMQKKLEEYTAKVPDAMNTQYKETRLKKEAVERYNLRQDLVCTEPESGKANHNILKNVSFIICPFFGQN